MTGQVGAIAIVPGFLGTQSYVSWYGPLLAAQGFIAFTIDTNTLFDAPASRADQLLAAVDYVATRSVVASHVDSGRLAVAGWSMGGGGALEAAAKRPSLKAVMSLAGWDTNTNFSSVVVPTLLVGCQLDTVAPPASHSNALYNSIPATTPKAYLEITGGSHLCVTTTNDAIGRTVVAWSKRFVKGDASASSLLCPPPAVGGSISASRANCPY